MRAKEFISEAAKQGLWANIHAKRERIKNGSGEKMRKPGSKGAPSAQDFKDSQKTSKTDEAANPAQQAAIAVSMKEKGKKPKSLEEQFDLIEQMIDHLAESNGVDSDMIWEDFESLNDDELTELSEDWQKVNKRDKTDGMSKKAVKAYRRENPGSKLKTAVTTKPSKLKKGSKAAKRRKSFCARMSGMKKAHASAKTKRDPDSPINKALRRWNC